MKQQVEGHSNLYKDPVTDVIVNRDSCDRQKYRIAKQQARLSIESKNEISELRREVKKLSNMKEEMDEIKSLLKQILNK